MSALNVSILGGSGYAGGELLRLLLDHPDVTVAQVTSESNVGKFVHTRHPNLRRRTMLKFVSAADLAPCDVLFVALPHGQAMGRIDDLSRLARGDAAPIETAQRWTGDEQAPARLYHAADLALAQAAGLTDPARIRKLAQWLDAANRTRDLLRTTVRADLAIAELLVAWRAVPARQAPGQERGGNR